jgi:transposase
MKHECVFERVWENVPFEDDNICPHQEQNKMEKQMNIVCGAVAIESTGVYWIPIYTVLEGIEVILANAYKVKHTPGKKTDKRDS